MTAGAPLYLVSACTSGEEFIAAFRRYADRNGVLFIPTAEPLASGKRGRIAVTLIDGGVMIEGEAEVVSASRTPSVLYGRIGMTVKFTGPDDPSKTLLAELEKARLAAKPAPPSVAPRPAELPSERRPTPPPKGGRIDAANALAECIILGELPDAVPTPIAQPGSGRVQLPLGRVKSPTHPPGRVKTPTTPPIPTRAKTPTSPSLPALAPSTIPPPIPSPPGSKPTSLGMGALKMPPPPPGFLATPPATIHGVSSVARAPAPPLSIAPPPPILEPDPPAPPPPTTPPTPRKIDLTETMRGPVPAPVVAPARPKLPEVEIAEPTELAPIPSMPEVTAATEEMAAQAEPTSIGPPPAPEGVTAPQPTVEEPTPSGDWTMTPGASGPTITPRVRPQTPPAGAQTGDWAMEPDPARPDGWSEPSKVNKRIVPEAPQPGPPVSTVSSERPLDSDTNPPPEPVIEAGPSIQVDPTLASAPIVDEDAPPAAAAPILDGPFVAPLLTPTDTPAVQISPEEHLAMLGIAPGAAPPLPVPMAPMPPMPPTIAAPEPRFGTERAYSPSDLTSTTTRARSRHVLVIGASAVAVVVIGIVLVLSLGGGKDDAPAANRLQMGSVEQPAPTPTPVVTAGSAEGSSTVGSAKAPDAIGSNAAPAVGSNAAPPPDEQVAAGSNAATPPEEPEVPAPPAPPTPRSTDGCAVAVGSVPQGAEIVVAKEVVGTTPAKITLPCSTETRVTIKRARYVASTVTVKPNPDRPRPIKVALARITMTVKVSSAPSGATITLGNKAIGVTPTTIKLPAYEASTVKITKPGFAPETRKITPKQANLSLHAVLKRGSGKR